LIETRDFLLHRPIFRFWKQENKNIFTTASKTLHLLTKKTNWLKRKKKIQEERTSQRQSLPKINTHQCPSAIQSSHRQHPQSIYTILSHFFKINNQHRFYPWIQIPKTFKTSQCACRWFVGIFNVINIVTVMTVISKYFLF
jgi:hypothetical protein